MRCYGLATYRSSVMIVVNRVIVAQMFVFWFDTRRFQRNLWPFSGLKTTYCKYFSLINKLKILTNLGGTLQCFGSIRRDSLYVKSLISFSSIPSKGVKPSSSS